MRAVILAVGSELVRGRTVDTNSTHIAARLTAAGATVVGTSCVPDSVDAIARAMLRASEDADILIVTGGLGPTFDDLTREGLAKALGVENAEHPVALEYLHDAFAARGRVPSGTNIRQALLPAGCTPVRNPVGTAPAVAGNIAGTLVFCLPGIPGEMRALLASAVIPAIRDRISPVSTLAFKLCGPPEAAAAELLCSLDIPSEVESIINVSFGVITVFLTAPAGYAGLPELGERIRSSFGDDIVSMNGESLETVVLDLARSRGLTVGCVESCTGGLIAAALTSVPGSSSVFKGGVVAYADAVKSSIGVPEELIAEHGAVSVETVCAMAVRGRVFLGVDLCVAVSGIAGPSGGTEEKPVGTVHLAVAHSSGIAPASLRLSGSRDHIRRFSATRALDQLRRSLLRVGSEEPV